DVLSDESRVRILSLGLILMAALVCSGCSSRVPSRTPSNTAIPAERPNALLDEGKSVKPEVPATPVSSFQTARDTSGRPFDPNDGRPRRSNGRDGRVASNSTASLGG